MKIEAKDFEFGGGLKKTSMVLIAVGFFAILGSFSLNKTVGWVDFLVNNIYFATLGVSGLFVLGVTGVLTSKLGNSI
jgi:hypothetical protein